MLELFDVAACTLRVATTVLIGAWVLQAAGRYCKADASARLLT